MCQNSFPRKLARTIAANLLPLLPIWWGPVYAQGFDPNIQERLESLTPDLPSPPPPGPVVEEVVVTPDRVSTVARDDGELNALFVSKREELPLAKFRTLSAQNFNALPKAAKLKILGKDAYKQVLIPGKTALIKRPAAPSFKIRLVAQTTYDTNSLRTPSSPIEDGILTVSPISSLVVPIGLDSQFEASAGTSSVRYDEQTQKSSDILNGGLAYNVTLDRSYGDPAHSPALTTTHSLKIGTSTSSSYSPGFEDRAVSFLTPAIGWSWDNIPVRAEKCEGKYCLFSSLGGVIDYSLSEIDLLENTTATATASIGWRTPMKGVTLTGKGTIKGKHFTDVSREDLIYEAATEVAWSVAANATLYGVARYTSQESTLTSAEWDNFSAFTYLKFEFEPCPSR